MILPRRPHPQTDLREVYLEETDRRGELDPVFAAARRLADVRGLDEVSPGEDESRSRRVTRPRARAATW